MHISLIAAMTEKSIIGKDNQLPWHIPEDLKYFKQITLGKPVVMGRKTFESMRSKPLPNRHNIILTTDLKFKSETCSVVHSISEAIKVVGQCEEMMVIGGATIYQQFLPLATRLYLSIVHENYDGDTYFPSITWDEWELKKENPGVLFTTKIYERRDSLR
nr:Dihydrofolate reductase [uncultured bacterium]